MKLSLSTTTHEGKSHTRLIGWFGEDMAWFAVPSDAEGNVDEFDVPYLLRAMLEKLEERAAKKRGAKA